MQKVHVGCHCCRVTVLGVNSEEEFEAKLADTSGLLSAPVRRRCISTGEHFHALQPVARETAEISFSTRMEVRHRSFSTSRLFGEGAAQHKSWNKMEIMFLLSYLGEFVVICCIAINQ